MTKKLSERFEVPVTWFRNKVRNDPFLSARYKILTLYFITGAVMLVGTGFISDYLLHHDVYPIAISQNGDPVRQAFRQLRQDLWLERFVLLVFFAGAAFLITEMVLRPIKKSAEIQQRFIAIVSHELRTPLTIMKNAAEISLRNKDKLTLEKATHVIESSLEETNRISDTISFLLSFSVLGERRSSISLQPVSLDKIADEVLSVIKKRYEDKGVQLALEVSSPEEINGDATALKLLVFNLVENAVLHTPPGGKVTVSLSKEKKLILLSVRDMGEGISDKDKQSIFEPFYRGSEPSHAAQAVKGMGLGLTLVKEIAEFHHALVSVTSAKGGGSIFTVHFRA